MPVFYNIADWNELPWFSTGGTRAKMYLQGPDGSFWYFKESQKKEATGNKPGKDFKYEFWSEVIAFELGTKLGFDVLRYDVAYGKGAIGCISRSMINSDEEELLEGVKYLQAYVPNYNPELKEHQYLYDFQNIVKALDAFDVGKYKNHLIETIVFDSIIGNSDRHQENWALINEFSVMSKELAKIESDAKKGIYKSTKRLVKSIFNFDKNELNYRGKAVKLYFSKPKGFAPIYDSGSSLARELTEERVEFFLQNESAVLKYIANGKSEIHWNGVKISHFELIAHLLESSYFEIVKQIIERTLTRFDGTALESMIRNVDSGLPEVYREYAIPVNRKELMMKLITLRIEKLRTLLLP